MPKLAEELLTALEGLLGSDGLRTGERASQLDPGIQAGNLDAGVVALPRDTAGVAGVLALCHRHGVSVVPQGGRTGLAGGAKSSPGQLVLATERLDRIEHIDPASGTVRVGSGVRLQALQSALAAHGLSIGIDLGARGSCTIGGMISTNAGGMEAFRYGNMRQRVLGLEAVLADGSVLSDLTGVLKANTGYDVKQLLIGSEGTLGVVTRAVLALVPVKPAHATALVAAPDAASAIALLRRLQRSAGSGLTHTEVMWRNHVQVVAAGLGLGRLAEISQAPIFLVVEVAADTDEAAGELSESILGAAAEAGEIDAAILAKSESERADIWRIREDWGVDRAYPGGLWYDISVPLGQLADYVARLESRIAALGPELRLFIIGHLGDGNLHVTVNSDRPISDRYEPVSEAVYADLGGYGGAISAEHGIGLDKKAALARHGDPVKLAMMRAIKRALDPEGLLNPGKVVVG